MISVPQSVKIPDWPYYITIDGQVFREGKSHPLKPRLRRDGYVVNLSEHRTSGGKSQYYRVSNLMRMCYFGNTPLPLRHKNGLAADFSYWNLEPVPRAELCRKIAPERGNARAVICTQNGIETVYTSIIAAARANYVAPSTIRKYCNSTDGRMLDGVAYKWEDPLEERKPK